MGVVLLVHKIQTVESLESVILMAFMLTTALILEAAAAAIVAK